MKKIIVLAPHIDDGELGCGGLISKLVEEGKDVYYVSFSSAEKSVPKGFPRDILKKEIKCAAKSMGIPNENLILFEYDVRNFPFYRQQILENMVDLMERIKPDLVLMPSTFDTHQDHQVVSQEGFRAFKKTSILGYEILWNNLTFETSCFVPLTEEQMNKKCEALECYHSQMYKATKAFNSETVKSLAKVRGAQINSKYAEAFQIIRWIL